MSETTKCDCQNGWVPSELGGSVPCANGCRPNLGVLALTPPLAQGPDHAASSPSGAEGSANCSHDWVPMTGGEICYGCNSIRHYSSVSVTAPEPIPSPPSVEARGEAHIGLGKRWWVYFEGDAMHGTSNESRAEGWKCKDPGWIHEVSLYAAPPQDRVSEAMDRGQEWVFAVARELDAEWKKAMRDSDVEYANRLTALRTRVDAALAPSRTEGK